MYNKSILNGIIPELKNKFYHSTDNDILKKYFLTIAQGYPTKQGSGRFVIIVDKTFVIKIAMNPNGLMQNTIEAETPPAYHLAKILDSITLFGCDNFLIVQEYHKPLEDYYDDVLASICPSYQFDETHLTDIFTEENIDRSIKSPLDEGLIYFTLSQIDELELGTDATFENFWMRMELDTLASCVLKKFDDTVDINIENIGVKKSSEYVLLDYGIKTNAQLSKIINSYREPNNPMKLFTVEDLKEKMLPISPKIPLQNRKELTYNDNY